MTLTIGGKSSILSEVDRTDVDKGLYELKNLNKDLTAESRFDIIVKSLLDSDKTIDL